MTKRKRKQPDNASAPEAAKKPRSDAAGKEEKATDQIIVKIGTNRYAAEVSVSLLTALRAKRRAQGGPKAIKNGRPIAATKTAAKKRLPRPFNLVQEAWTRC